MSRLKLVKGSRLHLAQWIEREREYADSKYPDKSLNDRRMLQSEIGWWDIFIDNYLSRARVLGLNNPSGREALAKLIVTAMDCLESSIRVYGALPPPKPPISNPDPG